MHLIRQLHEWGKVGLCALRLLRRWWVASFVNQHICCRHQFDSGLPQLENDAFLDHLGLVVVSTPIVGGAKKEKKNSEPSAWIQSKGTNIRNRCEVLSGGK